MNGKLAGAAIGLFVCYVLGRLKIAYYYKAFGIEPSSLEIPLRDLMFESWFVAQNVVLFALIWWLVLKTRVIWVALVALLHALIPIASHYAFLDAERWSWLIAYRHTSLKLLPFLVLGIVWFAHPRCRDTLRRLSPPVPPAGMALFAIVTVFWGISTAKHFGSFDANLALRWPDRNLLRIEGQGEGRLFLLHAGPRRLILWDAEGFVYGESEEVRTRVVPREAAERLEGSRRFEVQPGSRYL